MRNDFAQVCLCVLQYVAVCVSLLQYVVRHTYEYVGRIRAEFGITRVSDLASLHSASTDRMMLFKLTKNGIKAADQRKLMREVEMQGSFSKMLGTFDRICGSRQREREREKGRERERERDRERDEETERQGDRETERQRDRKTGRQRDRETEAQRHRDTDTDTDTDSKDRKSVV